MIQIRHAIALGLLITAIGLSTGTRAQEAEPASKPPAQLTDPADAQAQPEARPMDERVDQLVTQLGDEDYYQREAAQAALGALPSDALIHMARHYRDTSDAEVRMRLEQVARQAFRDSLLDEYLTIDRQPFLGIQMQRQAMPDGSATIAVIAVLDDTAASQAGLQAGDSIVQVDGRTPPPDRPTAWLVQYIQGQQVGDQLQLNLLRNGRPMALTATLGPRPTDLVDDARRQAMLQRADQLEKTWWTHAFTRGRVRIPDALLDEENAPQSGSEQDGNTSDSPQR